MSVLTPITFLLNQRVRDIEAQLTPPEEMIIVHRGRREMPRTPSPKKVDSLKEDDVDDGGEEDGGEVLLVESPPLFIEKNRLSPLSKCLASLSPSLSISSRPSRCASEPRAPYNLRKRLHSAESSLSQESTTSSDSSPTAKFYYSPTSKRLRRSETSEDSGIDLFSPGGQTLDESAHKSIKKKSANKKMKLISGDKIASLSSTPSSHKRGIPKSADTPTPVRRARRRLCF